MTETTIKTSKSMKGIITTTIIVGILLLIGAFLLGRYAFPNDPSRSVLPAPEVTSGQRGDLGIDANINESTIDQYLNRPDAVYRDVRLLEDPGNYAAIGGDAMLSGFVDGFEVISFPYLANVEGLPAEVGATYQGKTLFTNQNGTYTPNYVESAQILEDLFPKDKTIFLMCGGGGYSGMLKNMLVSLGWDENKIYDVGGYWFYNGDHNVEVKRTTENGETVYDFYKVPYHDIDFETLTEVTSGQ